MYFFREFLEWLVENIKGSGFGSTWKTLVAYQKITRCKENIGVERAYGAMFYAYGGKKRKAKVIRLDPRWQHVKWFHGH